MAYFEATVDTGDNQCTAVARLSVDNITAPHMTGEFKTDLLRFVNREKPDVLVLDWSAINRAGTDTFGVMLAVQKRLRDWNGSLRLCGMNPLLSEGFVQCGLNQLIPLYPDVPGALDGKKERA